jgi:hypothetical protein
MSFSNIKDDGDDDEDNGESDSKDDDSQSSDASAEGSGEGGESATADTPMITKDAVEYVENLFSQGEHDLIKKIKLVEDA